MDGREQEQRFSALLQTTEMFLLAAVHGLVNEGLSDLGDIHFRDRVVLRTTLDHLCVINGRLESFIAHVLNMCGGHIVVIFGGVGFVLVPHV